MSNIDSESAVSALIIAVTIACTAIGGLLLFVTLALR
jgi:hypothetical protein